MPKLTSIQKKYVLCFALLLVVGESLQLLSSDITHLWDAPTFFYPCLIIGWGITVGRRITHKRLRHLMNYLIVMMVMLFVVRLCKYAVFGNMAAVNRAVYYISIDIELVIAGGALLISYLIGTAENEKLDPFCMAVIFTNIGMMLLVSTNELHRMLYTFKNFDDGDYETQYGVLYYIVMALVFVQLLASAVIMIRKCSISAIRKYWYIPVLPMMIGLVLLAIYYISGGSPDISGVKIYNYQEVFCGAIAMMFECGIKIGMIPSCSGYEGMFRRSHINAAVVDKDNEYRYQSLNYDSDIDRENIRISEKAISGGKVIWMENLETIYGLNGMLSDAVEIVEAENTLIEKENAAKEESSRYEAQNRLYNSIAYFSNSKLRSIDKELFAKYDSEEEFKRHLSKSLVIGSYIKRRSNLTILAAENSSICLDELLLSINESMSYMRLYGINCMVHTTGDGIREKMLPSDLIISLYDVFQEVTEAVMDHANNIMVNVRNGGKVTFKMSADADMPDAAIRCRDTVDRVIGADSLSLAVDNTDRAIDTDDNQLYKNDPAEENDIAAGRTNIDVNEIAADRSNRDINNIIAVLFRKIDISEEDGIVTILLEAECSEEVTV